MSHSLFLALGYAVACGLWWATNRFVPLWKDPARPTFARPWREVALVLLGVVGTLLLGQLWSRGIRLEGSGWLGTVGESINQIVIFAPIMLVPVLRRNGWASAWIQRHALLLRVTTGVAFALVALFLYSQFEAGAPSYADTLRGVFDPSRAHLAVQVLLEDVAIAILFVRLAAALGQRKAIILVALLFAGAHIPAMVAQGASAADLLALVRDFGLGLLVLATLWRSADVAWLWPVHYALDMTQFLGGL
ncbi:MAG TPA: hypothetical protein VEC56_08905 [Candidatus Krumholzibacteria bacterium]|nr:hypothetical protein [Candidatus Krumholzibacteria bacterium]